MNKKGFIKLFLKLLEAVLELKPVQRVCDGVTIYASESNSLRILVFTGNKGLRYFIKNIPKDLRQKTKDVMQKRSCMIGDTPIIINGEILNMQIVLPAKALNLLCKATIDLKKIYGSTYQDRLILRHNASNMFFMN